MKTIYKKLLFLLLLLPFCAMAQNKVEGIVLDAAGLSIPGANVKIEGSSTGISTDFDGKFQLTNVKPTDVLIVSYMGYQTKSITVGNQTNLTIKLQEDANQLQEVVVQVGYGTVKKKDATGAVTVLGTKDFNKGPVVSADQMITGKVAGVQITSGGGSPGESATIRIRSGSSLSANNDPLYVIDNVPVATGGVEGGKNPLSTINPNDIASISILKDASATAIYGSRASNGVVLITTKKGKAGELKVSYNANFQVSEITDQVDALSTTDFKNYVNKNGTPAQIGLIGTAETNWQDEIYRTAFGTDHNINVMGGQDNITYRVSAGYGDFDGVLERDNMKKTSLNTSLTGDFFDKHLRIELNNNTSYTKSNYSNRDAIGNAIGFDPSQPVKNADGKYFQWYENGQLIQLANRNPVALIDQFNRYGEFFRSTGNIQFDYKLHFLPELKAVANFGYDKMEGQGYGDTSLAYLDGVKGSGAGDTYRNEENRNNKVMDLYLNYNKTVESINTTFDVTGGYTYQDFRDSKEKTSYNYENKTHNKELFNPTRVNLQSFFARANVTIADKYLLTMSYRRDGTSRFTEDNRWSNFPAVAVGWKLNEENFLKDVEVISSLKLRGGWGITGQQDIGISYPSVPLYLGSNDQARYQIGDTFYTTYRPEPYNSDLKWEETTTINAGIDFGFLENRITGSADVYQRDTENLLLNTYNPPFFGFSNKDNYNVGSIRNKGVELAIDVIPVKTDDWQWTIGGNVTFQDSKITALTTTQDDTPGIDVGVYSGGTGNMIQNHQVGYAPSSYYVYEQAYGTDGKPLDGVFIDRNGDGVVNEKDKYRYHKPAADIFYGFNTAVSYKNWDFSMNWRGSWGNFNYNNVDSGYGYQASVLIYQNNLKNSVEDLLYTDFKSNDAKRQQSDYYVQDASFLKLDNISLGYNFKNLPEWISMLKLTGSVQNVLTITDYPGLDPEFSGGIDNNLYPRPITYTLGLNCNF
jgi:TonB-dependent starch-binding outer membrane protein SusC